MEVLFMTTKIDISRYPEETVIVDSETGVILAIVNNDGTMVDPISYEAMIIEFFTISPDEDS